MSLITYHGKQEIKDFYLARVRAHAKADELVKGQYWEGGKGCAVGCTIHDSDHGKYETELGIPRWLARVEDRLFEGLPNERAKVWPEEFLSVIAPGADLEKAKVPFLIFVLEFTLDKFDHEKYPNVKKAVDKAIELYKNGETDLEKFREARANAAYADANAAYAAAYAAADADANAAYAAAYAARKEAYVKFADKLLELLKECK